MKCSQNRRKFVRNSVLTLTGAGLAGIAASRTLEEMQLSSNPASSPEVKFATRYELLPGEGVLEKFGNAMKYGFEGVSLPGRYLQSYIAEMKQVKNEIPVPLVSISLGFAGSLVSPLARLRNRCKDSLVKLFDLCHELRIGSVNMPPVLKQDNPRRYTDERIQDDLLISQLSDICEEAKKRKVLLLIEPVNRYETDYLTTLGHAARICREVNHEFLGITADFFHMQIEELKMFDSITEAGRWIKHVHVAENTRVEPGPGSLDFAPGFAALRRIPYRGYIEIESRTLSGRPEVVFPRSLRYLKNLLYNV